MINCADYHLPNHDANIIQLSNSYPHVSPFLQKLIFFFDNSKYIDYQKETFMINA